MKSTVPWAKSAEDYLADLWISAEDRESIRGAADDLDGMLAHRPLSLGESRNHSVRIAFSFPLGIEYEVNESDKTVLVLADWTYGTE